MLLILVAIIGLFLVSKSPEEKDDDEYFGVYCLRNAQMVAMTSIEVMACESVSSAMLFVRPVLCLRACVKVSG